jgi:hypothetical protein
VWEAIVVTFVARAAVVRCKAGASGVFLDTLSFFIFVAASRV